MADMAISGAAVSALGLARGGAGGAAADDDVTQEAGGDWEGKEEGEGEEELWDDACSLASWGKLVAVFRSYPSIFLKEKETRVGRSDATRDRRVSKEHCRIWKDESGGVVVQDRSVNGTLLSGARLVKDKVEALRHGDLLVLGPCAASFPAYVFQDVRGRRKRGRSESAGGDGEGEAGRKKLKMETVAEEEDGGKRIKMMDSVKCSICWNVWHDAVSVAPCLHTFCNSCFSDWYRRSTSYNSACKCPQCRGPVVSVGRNHTLCSVLEEILKVYPGMRRSAVDIAKMDKNAIVKSDVMRLVDPDMALNSDAYVHSDGDTQSQASEDEAAVPANEDEDRGTCRQCLERVDEAALPANASAFRCNSSTVHITCSSCNHLMPCRPELDVLRHCAVCQSILCDPYWRSQNFPPSGCHIKPLSSWFVSDSNSNALEIAYSDNEYEVEVTRRYMVEHHVTVPEVMTEWMGKIASGEVELPEFQVGQPPIPTPPPASLSPTISVCAKCHEALTKHIFFKYRQSIPKSELPPEAAQRPDCWYGYHCFTQFNSREHRERYNHVCEPDPTRNVRVPNRRYYLQLLARR